jgi:hypothetical protein
VTGLPVALAPGDYRFAITRWSVKALRVTEQLWYGMESITTPGLTVGEKEAEQVLLTVARAGTDWPKAATELDLTVETDHIWALLDVSRARYDAYVQDVAAQNSDRADLQKQTLENHLASQDRKYRELRARHLARNNPGLARAAERSLEKLRLRVEREILRIEQNRKLSHSFDQVCVGVVRVEPA